jgi:hypothetical protein
MKKLLRSWTFALLAVLAWLPNPYAAADQVALVSDGQANATIVTAADPTPAARLAAMELQYFVELATGATLPIADDAKDVDGLKIFIGQSRFTDQAGLKPEAFGYVETLIDVSPERIVLFGRDEPVNDTMPSLDYPLALGGEASGEKMTVPGNFDYQGSLRATYRFIEDFCEIHILGPWPINFVYTERDTLTVPIETERHVDALLTRHGSTGYEENLALWGGKQLERNNYLLFHRRMRFGGAPWYINHTFEHMRYNQRFIRPQMPDKDSPNYDEELKKYNEHVQFFEYEIPVLADPERKNQFSFSDRQVIEQVAQDARDFFDGKLGNKGDKYIQELQGRSDVFPVVPYDVGGYQETEESKPLQDAGIGREGYGFNNGRYSDYVFNFVNEVARAVAKTHPDKYIGTLAYEEYYWKPVTLELEPNVVIAPCMHPMYWERMPKVRANEEGWYKKWVEHSQQDGDKPIYMWNYDFPVTYMTYYGVSRGHMVKDWLSDGIEGIFHCGSPEAVALYVTYELYEDPDRDPEALVQRYFELYFGEAANEMRAFYDMMVDLTTNESYYPLASRGGYIHVSHAEPNFVYTDERVQKLRELYEEAETLDLPDPYKSRIAAWEKAILLPLEENTRTFLGEKLLNQSVEAQKRQDIDFVEGFIPTVTAYAGDHWYASHPPDALVNSFGIKEDDPRKFGSKTADFETGGPGFYWPSYFPDQGAWLMFDLGATYELDELRVWNYNDSDGNTDWGLKNVTISYAKDTQAMYADEWQHLGDFTFNQAKHGEKDGPENVIDFEGKKVRYVYIHAPGPQGEANWRLPEKIEADQRGREGIFPDARIGLGKVRFYGEPLQAAKPLVRFVNDEAGLGIGLWSPTSGDATIRYTLDGSVPGPDSTKYTQPLDLKNDLFLRARTYADGLEPSDYSPVHIPFVSTFRKFNAEQEVAHGRPVTSSGEAQGTGQVGRRGANKINDGDGSHESAWWAAVPAWATINLEQPHTVNAIWVQSWWDIGPNGRVPRYTLQTSLDGEYWTDAVDMSRNEDPATAVGKLHRIDPVKAQYVRIVGLPWLCEMEVYGQPTQASAEDYEAAKASGTREMQQPAVASNVGGVVQQVQRPQLDGKEIAQGKPVKSSGEAQGSGQEGTRGADKINDGLASKDSAWWAAKPAWAAIDLKESHTLTSIWVLPWWDDETDGRVARYTIEVSRDGKNWRTVADHSDADKPATAAGDVHEFNPVKARYVKISGLEWLCEIEVYAKNRN